MHVMYHLIPKSDAMMPGALFSLLSTRRVYRVLAVGIKDGERFYFLSMDGSICLYPASVVQS